MANINVATAVAKVLKEERWSGMQVFTEVISGSSWRKFRERDQNVPHAA